MMDAELAGWTVEEQDLARAVFERAHSREVDVLIDRLRRQVSALSSAEQIWELHDFLSLQRHAIEGRLEFRLDGLLFVFAGFVRDGLISLEELEGLSGDKRAKISAMARF
ncbi:hypothetical protein [Synechococcus sp. CBW1004]|uniref:hypothetical protein n=1 Tax=Synechococcus sp. CBW1004 TaxID=1353136 RepID=UPI001E52B6A4|nr:hypothetical protein [Synechococcus sp. CBW1004]